MIQSMRMCKPSKEKFRISSSRTIIYRFIFVFYKTSKYVCFYFLFWWVRSNTLNVPFALLLKTVDRGGGGWQKGEGGKYFKNSSFYNLPENHLIMSSFCYYSKDPFNLPISVKIVSIQSPHFQNSTPHGSIKWRLPINARSFNISIKIHRPFNSSFSGY